MAKALGVGGVFFKCGDPKALSTWYRDTLGFELEENGSVGFKPANLPGGSLTVWGPFPATTEYFQPCRKDFMVNLIVDDLEGALRQVVEAGAETVGEIDESEWGRFGWFLDPEGNKVELWVPPEPSEPKHDQGS